MWKGLKKTWISFSAAVRLNRYIHHENESIFNSLRPYLQQLVSRHNISVNKIGLEKISQEEYRKVSRDISSLEPVVHLMQRLEQTEQNLNESRLLLSDPELKDIAIQEINDYERDIADIRRDLLRELVESQRDKDDINSAIIEVRPGAGGLEASLFTADIFLMYQRFARFNGWEFEILSVSETNLGGYRNASASVNGHGSYGIFKFESGVHRVQRIPQTDSKNKMHTSTMTVAVLPQPSEVDAKVNESDLKIETFRASGAGGQYVNTTDSAIRVTHIPTGTVVKVQDERSQHQNKIKAMKILKAKIYETEREKLEKERLQQRKQQIGTGERDERIRTYNFLQDRITDHRVGVTQQGVKEFLSGTHLLNDMIDKLKEQADTQSLLKLIEDHSTNGHTT